jgi:uncharacterized protein
MTTLMAQPFDRDPAGWRSMLAIVLVAPAPSVGAWWLFWHDPGAAGQVAYAIGKAWLYGLPAILWWWWLREPLRLGSTKRRPTADDWRLTVGIGVAIGVLIWATWAWIGPHLDLDAFRSLAEKNGLTSPLKYVLVASYICVVNALLEEYVFRWFFYGQLRRHMPKMVASVVAGLIFAAHHAVILTAQFEPGIAWLGTAGVFAGGLVWTWCYERSGSILPAWASHGIVDLAIMLVGWRMIFGG